MSDPHPYAGEAYARAFGSPHRALSVPEWGTSVLLRPIDATGREDATSCYPRTVLAADARLADGLARLRDAGAISVTLVLDPRSTPANLTDVFDIARPFKKHFIIDRQRGTPTFSRHHRYEIRRAARFAGVRKVALADHLGQWTELYHELVERHAITGIRRFSDQYFAALARLPDLAAYAAVVDERIVAMSLWLRHGDWAGSHLAATNGEGYRIAAAYLLYAAAIDDLRDCRWLDLGGTAGHTDDDASGLARFKRGFSNATADAWLCGHVLDKRAYAALCRDLPETTFFPAYRQPAHAFAQHAKAATIRSISASARSG